MGEGERRPSRIGFRVLSGRRWRSVPQSICPGWPESTIPLYTSFTIDELSLSPPRQKDLALAFLGARNGSTICRMSEQKFVTDLRQENPASKPSFYGASPMSGHLNRSAVAAPRAICNEIRPCKGMEMHFKSFAWQVQSQ